MVEKFIWASVNKNVDLCYKVSCHFFFFLNKENMLKNMISSPPYFNAFYSFDTNSFFDKSFFTFLVASTAVPQERVTPCPP